MQVAARPYLTAGVAFLGAGAIAISPVAPPMPDITVPAIASAHVELSAATSAFEAYVALITNTVTNLQTTIAAELDNPVPILRQVIANQISTATNLGEGLQGAAEGLANILDPANPFGIPAQLQQALTDLLAGNITGAVNNAWGALLSPVLNAGLPLLEPITAAIRQPIQNLLNVVDTQLAVVLPLLGALNVGYVTVTTAAQVGQDIVDSIRAGDPLGVANAMLGGPAVITDAFLNGGDLGGGVFGQSLGLLSTLRQAREMIAAAITPPAPEEARSAADATLAAAKVVTLDVSPKVATSTPVEAAPVEAAPAAEAPTTETAEAPAGAATPVVKDSLKAEPGKTLSTKRSTSAKQVREGVQGAVKNVTDGIKKAAEGLSGKSAKAGKDAKSGGESASSGSSNAA
ncbi:hypothetical protein [Mycolicibacterium neworleansense]|uniref:PE-PGRS family protein n=1 Tax=Mycolicibacterium neworleansense TaxID=146018 RepID=A0A0H5SA40_9MYCO|nr:hypothetical protein [Mycolicibacterium neworleansense]MCV7360786.1 hypothetical protein [Mycolicibacterium neworleansense]CRZ18209.1 PE-PGRS family protein [Mycolicibacterium neworleansense]